MSVVQIWDKPILGDLWTVGDIHGCYNLLIARLKELGFNFEQDLLVATGDLVDRGSQNIPCVSLLSEDWFTSVRGNHEDLCIGGLSEESYKRCHISNGGEWFYQLDGQLMYDIADKFSKLPVALEVNHRGKKYGFVHGHIEQNDWNQFKESLEAETSGFRDPAQLAMWGRARIEPENTHYGHVNGVDEVYMGHTVTRRVYKRDNCFYIDTGAVHYGTLTILKLGG